MTAKALPAIIVHGGAGQWQTGDLAPVHRGCELAARAGWQRLESGGSALDAVQAAVVALEDDPQFNAGIGATLNINGTVELDAAIMEGATRRAGAVAALRRIRNPIRLARAVLDDARHVLLVADGALEFAVEHGFVLCRDEELIVDRQRQRWQQHHGTVGAVAIDANGTLAAATSTGGIFGKLPGRVGDSALIGCGTYADDAAAVSCTGTGESIIRATLGVRTANHVRTGSAGQDAAIAALAELDNLVGGDAGLILVTRDGHLAYAKNTAGMPIFAITGGGTWFDC